MVAPGLDVFIACIVCALGIGGWLRGFVVSACALMGFVSGILLATRISQKMLVGGASNPTATLWGLAAALAASIVCASLFEIFGARVRSRIHASRWMLVDQIGGAGASMIGGLLLVWLVAASVFGIPALRELRPYVRESYFIPRLNAVLPPSGPLLNQLSRYDPLPSLDGPHLRSVPAPDLSSIRQQGVRQAASGVVRVVGSACGFEVTGSGWVVEPDTVVTNAHVIAGERDTAVQVAGRGRVMRAEVRHIDRVADLAILHVSDLDLRPLPVADGVADANTAAAVLGYPENGPFSAAAARTGDTRPVRTTDIDGAGPVSRMVLSFRGSVRHGNSGGPLVNEQGQVVGTVFASTVDANPAGGYAVPNERVMLALASQKSGVDTGACAP